MRLTSAVRQDDEFSKAKRCSFQFLKVRNRSQKEIKDQLNKKKFNPQTIEQTVQYLKSVDLINDRQFARDWIRIRLNKPFGLRRIFFELKNIKGISEEILKEEITLARQDFKEEPTIEALAKKCALKYKNLEAAKRKRRLYEYLARRGFNIDIITKVIERI